MAGAAGGLAHEIAIVADTEPLETLKDGLLNVSKVVRNRQRFPSTQNTEIASHTLAHPSDWDQRSSCPMGTNRSATVITPSSEQNVSYAHREISSISHH